jgi:hypothetical protein
MPPEASSISNDIFEPDTGEDNIVIWPAFLLLEMR